MNQLLKTLVLFIFLPLVLMAHGDHTQEISQNTIRVAAKEKVRALAKSNKIPMSWKSVSMKEMRKVQYEYVQEWVVIFDNKKIENSKKKRLYIFVDLHGMVVGANYTGK